MKIRLIALILCGLLLAAPTMRAPAECAEIAPEPPAVNTEGLRAQPAADFFAETEEITAEEPAASPSPAAAAAPSPAGGGTEADKPAAPEVWREDVPLSAELQAALLAICEEAGVDPLLALGLIETESNFVTDAVSRTGDYGLCQLNHNYFDPNMTPEENLRAGIGYLGNLLEKHRTTEAALTAYHVGHDDGTRSYAAVVLGHAAAWGYGA